jgi:hypothetical protein
MVSQPRGPQSTSLPQEPQISNFNFNCIWDSFMSMWWQNGAVVLYMYVRTHAYIQDYIYKVFLHHRPELEIAVPPTCQEKIFKVFSLEDSFLYQYLLLVSHGRH